MLIRRTYARARRRPGTQPARASAAPTNPRREPIAVSTHAGTPAGKVPSKCTYIDRRTRGARRRRTSSGPQRCAAATTRTCVTACDAEYLVCTYIDGSARPPSPSPGGSPRFAPCRTKPFHFISTYTAGKYSIPPRAARSAAARRMRIPAAPTHAPK